MIAINRDGKVILAWVPYEHDIEQGALQQAMNLSKLPFLAGPVVLMPDVHQGYGMPIGGVIATKKVISPACVGVDIGCGVALYRTSLREISIADIKKWMGLVRKRIPLGRNWKQKSDNSDWMPIHIARTYVVNKLYDHAAEQLGSLGGGNHFIELQRGSDDMIYIMIHSGSRNLGHKLGTHYSKMAKQLNAQWHSKVPPSWDLAYLPIDDQAGGDYLVDMGFAVEYAKCNRNLIIERAIESLHEVTGCDGCGQILDVAHNYAAFENFGKQNPIIHRKGAIRAREGDVCIIPGCQGGYSYLGVGLGNVKSWNSASHGAGRTMSRSKARKVLDLDEQIALMGDTVHGIRTVADLDEAQGAYKDIIQVMANQKDLVKWTVRLKGIAVIKG